MNVIRTLTNASALRFSVFAGRFTAAVSLAFLARLLWITTGVVFLIADDTRSTAAGRWPSGWPPTPTGCGCSSCRRTARS